MPDVSSTSPARSAGSSIPRSAERWSRSCYGSTTTHSSPAESRTTRSSSVRPTIRWPLSSHLLGSSAPSVCRTSRRIPARSGTHCSRAIPGDDRNRLSLLSPAGPSRAITPRGGLAREPRLARFRLLSSQLPRGVRVERHGAVVGNLLQPGQLVGLDAAVHRRRCEPRLIERFLVLAHEVGDGHSRSQVEVDGPLQTGKGGQLTVQITHER